VHPGYPSALCDGRQRTVHFRRETPASSLPVLGDNPARERGGRPNTRIGKNMFHDRESTTDVRRLSLLHMLSARVQRASALGGLFGDERSRQEPRTFPASPEPLHDRHASLPSFSS
jgi:hypothetical protein